MFEIKITGNSAAEALADLAELARMMGLSVAPTQDQSEPEPSVETAPAPKHHPEAAPEPEPEPPVGDWEPGGGEATEEILTPESVRAAGIKASKVHGKPAIRAVFQELGVSGFTNMPPEKYPEFMRKLGELDAE